MRVSGVNQSYITSVSNDPSTDEQNADSTASGSGTAQGSTEHQSTQATHPNDAGGNASARRPGDAVKHLERFARSAGDTREALPNGQTSTARRLDVMTNHRANFHARQHGSTDRGSSSSLAGVIPASGRAGARNWYPLGSLTSTALPHADESGNLGLRVKRGPAFSTCIKDRGGNALARNAIAIERFDQVDYPESHEQASGGLCEGMVREAMRRVDLAWTDQPMTGERQEPLTPPLMSAVHNMHADTSRLLNTRTDMFNRIQNFQSGRTALGFNHYTPQPSVRLHSAAVSRDTRVNVLINRLNRSLQRPNDMAYVQLSLDSPEGRRDYGHAILVQRGATHHYSIFDPNNGAFEYRDWNSTANALREYMDSAFRNRRPFDELPPFSAGNRYRTTPFKMQVYLSKPPAVRTSEPVLEPQRGALGYGPPEFDCENRIYQQHAVSSNEISLESLFPDGAERAGVRSPAESVGTYVLQEIASGTATTLSDAAGNLRFWQSNQETREQTVLNLNSVHEQHQSTSTSTMANHIRHSGTFAITTADSLVNDLRTHFSEPYVGDGGPRPLHNDIAVIDLALGPQAAGTSTREASRPVIVQRLNVNSDAEHDRYELFDPNFGVFAYDGLQNLSDTIGRIYNTGYGTEGGIAHATTTWYASEAGIRDPGDSLSETRPLLPSRTVTLDEAEEMGGLVPVGPLVPPSTNLPPEPVNYRPSLQNYMDHLNAKRATGPSSNRDPWVLFRPSTDTPDKVAKRGGFNAGRTRLRDVNLQMHNFDIASHGAQTDSAGYVGAFRLPSTALIRQQRQPADGYIYAIAPSLNMVDVNASLGPHTLAPDNQEFAAVGQIDNTQIIGWWRTQDLQKGLTSRFMPNPVFRWDVYNWTRTAGAQPQLARFPMNSPAWQEPAYKPFSTPVMQNGKQIGLAPKEDPNLTLASFYLNSRLKTHQAATRQTAGEDYHGPITLRAYGGEWPYILYADASDNLHVYRTSYAQSTAGSMKQFALSNDGRFHYTNNYNKVLLVGHDGYLYVGAIPGNPRSLNGVFRFDGTNPFRLLHLEDTKYLTVGKSVSTPFVTDYRAGYRSDWRLTDSRGNKVTPPASNYNSYYWASTVGDRAQLYEFDLNPDSILPPGTTQFVTHMLADFFQGSFSQYPRHLDQAGGAAEAIEWLASRNAAWLFRDGFYAVPTGPDRLEVRTLGGKPVFEATVDLKTGHESYRTLGPTSSGFRINEDVWKDLQFREDQRLELEDRLRRT
ncbi:enterotoxin A family protein [Paraburkholderia xenovorans]